MTIVFSGYLGMAANTLRINNKPKRKVRFDSRPPTRCDPPKKSSRKRADRSPQYVRRPFASTRKSTTPYQPIYPVNVFNTSAIERECAHYHFYLLRTETGNSICTLKAGYGENFKFWLPLRHNHFKSCLLLSSPEWSSKQPRTPTN